jgi:uncharacterized tellurite resistance protein B-like protein
MDARDRFRLLTALALVDGRLDPPERKVLLRAAKRLELDAEEAEAMLAEMVRGGRVSNLVPPHDPDERRALFDDLVKVALADGVVAPQERATLERLAPSFGVAPDALAAALAPRAAVSLAAPAPVKTKKVTAKTGEASCPSCGAPVEFKNARSVAMVCAYCDTTVVRGDRKDALEDLGKVSHVVEDASPVRIGASGTALGVEFVVLGRLQLEHPSGFWNEWFLQWADGRTGWLGEALGQYMITFPDADPDGEPAGHVPAFDQLRLGQHVVLSKKAWEVTEKQVARATGTQGETPFSMASGYELPFADLRRNDAGFATLDYSDETPRAFVGRCVAWKDLAMRGHRTFHGW